MPAPQLPHKDLLFWVAVVSFEMAGGTWILAGLESAAVSEAGAGVRHLIGATPSGVVRVEVAKCQMSVALRIENGSCSKADVATHVEKLDELKQAVEKDLSVERELNDPGAHRIRELEEKVKTLQIGREWIARRVG